MMSSIITVTRWRYVETDKTKTNRKHGDWGLSEGMGINTKSLTNDCCSLDFDSTMELFLSPSSGCDKMGILIKVNGKIFKDF